LRFPPTNMILAALRAKSVLVERLG